MDSGQLLFCTLSMTLEYTQVVSNPDEIRRSPFMVVPSSGHLTKHSVASFPGLHAQLLLLAVRKAGRRPGQIYHAMHAAADVMFSLLTSGFVLSPSLFFP